MLFSREQLEGRQAAAPASWRQEKEQNSAQLPREEEQMTVWDYYLPLCYLPPTYLPFPSYLDHGVRHTIVPSCRGHAGMLWLGRHPNPRHFPLGERNSNAGKNLGRGYPHGWGRLEGCLRKWPGSVSSLSGEKEAALLCPPPLPAGGWGLLLKPAHTPQGLSSFFSKPSLIPNPSQFYQPVCLPMPEKLSGRTHGLNSGGWVVAGWSGRGGKFTGRQDYVWECSGMPWKGFAFWPRAAVVRGGRLPACSLCSGCILPSCLPALAGSW